MDPRQLSRELRHGSDPDLNRRRWIVGLSFVGATMAQLVSLYQIGVLKKLPDPPVPLFDSSKVDASAYAYRRLDTPDGFMMLVNYGLTAMLAGAGPEQRATCRPWLSLAMGAKLLADAATTIRLTQEEWGENQALCFYCQVATMASLIAVGVGAPEVLRAAKVIAGQGQAVIAERQQADRLL